MKNAGLGLAGTRDSDASAAPARRAGGRAEPATRPPLELDEPETDH